MLKDIRKTLKGAAALIVVLLLVISFVAWGVPEISQIGRREAIEVGGVRITSQQVDKEFSRLVINQQAASQGQFDRAAAIAAGVPAQLVTSIATRAAIDLEAKKMGVSMTDKMVQDFLQSAEEFKNPSTGKFDAEALNQILQTYNYAPQEFRDQIRDDLRRDQLVSAVSRGTPAPGPLVEAMLLREFERRTISYITVSEDIAGPAKEPTPQALREYYEARTGDFMAPEYRTFTLVTLKGESLVDRSKVDEAALRKLYDAQKARYSEPERRTLYQAQFNDREAAEKAAERLKAGAPFETIAAELGVPLAAATQTDVTKAEIVDPGVADAAFAAGLAAGAILGPVEGVFGFTVAQIVDVKAEAVRPFEEVRAELEEQLLSQDTRRRLFDAIEAIEADRDQGISLADAARKSGATVETFGPVDSFSFGTGGEIVAGIPGEALAAAFKAEDGEETEAAEFADKSGYYFVSVDSITPPAPTPYDIVAAEVEERWRADERNARINAIVKSLRDAVDSGKSLAEAGAALNRAPVTVTLSRGRPSEAISQEALNQAFAVAKGEAISAPVALGTGQIVAVVDAIAFDSSQVNADTFNAFSQYVASQLDQELIAAYADAVREEYGVKVDQAQIDALFGASQ